MKKKIQSLIDKYEKYIYNLEWHINTNKPEGESLLVLKRQVGYFKEMLADLKSLTK